MEPTSSHRSPLEVLAALGQAGAGPEGGGSGHPAPLERLLLHERRPIVGSLEWVLARRYWETTGLDGFVRSEVPYVVNNTAWLAESAAAVLLAAGTRLASTTPIRLLELGAGLGLFAKQLLDVLEERCQREGRTEYDRLTFYVTDGSSRTVARWQEEGLFAAHAGHVVLARCDAENPTTLFPLAAQEGDDGVVGKSGTSSIAQGTTFDSPAVIQLPHHSLHAVFCHYVLDTLPATILRRTESDGASRRPEGAGATDATERLNATLETRFEEQRVRTYISEAHREDLVKRFGLHWEELRELSTTALSGGPGAEGASDRLLPILPCLEFEVDYDLLARPRASEIPQEIATWPADRLVWNHGALAAIEALLPRLARGGFLLVRDLGPVDTAAASELSYVARFGSSLAFTIAFPILEAVLTRLGASVLTPPGDADRAIHTRLVVAAGEEEPLKEAFCHHFGDDRHARADALATQATRQIHAGQFAEALRSYHEALALCPDDWHLLGQIAQFLTQQLLRPAEAAEVAERALALQPHFSAFLWNTLGNARFCLGEQEEAHTCYLRARTIHPSDPQTELNLAYTFLVRGQLEAALDAIARGLAYDRDERFEAALLTKQKEVLATLQRRRREEDERSERRFSAFSSAR